MRLALMCSLLVVPALVWARPSDDPNGKPRVEVTGCVAGSTLTETNLQVSSESRGSNPKRRWRLRGSKSLMRQLKELAGKELRIIGTTNEAKSGLLIGQTKVGKARIYVGSGIGRSPSEPLPDLPTIDIESFDATGERCR